jgi:hypothetical protein
MRPVFVWIAAVFVLGVVTMRFTIEDGMEPLETDAELLAAAEQAYRLARAHRDHPLQRILSPAASVKGIQRLAGCPAPTGGAGTTVEALPYAVLVRFYTLFGIAVGDVYVSCGNATGTRPADWPLPG